jgi:tyrosyl-tRNA synthetase
MDKKLFEFLQKKGYVYQTTDEAAVKKLCNGKPMTLYCGIDPTADSLHIGHCFPLIILRHFQNAGHRIIILLGGATAMIGDPSGKREMRKMVSQDFITSNLDSIKKIIGKFLNLGGENPITFVNNYDWFKNLNYVEFMREIGVHFNVNKMLATEAYSSRLNEGGLTFFEMGYMLMQAYDFVYLNKKYGCSMQIGGSDQWANILAGVELGRKLAHQEGKSEQNFQAMTCPLLLNSEGNKMGKTEKGAVWVLKEKTSPFEFYQYFYNQNDADVERFLKILSDLSVDEVSEIMKGDIRDAKHRMAFEVTKLIHGEADAKEAQDTAKNLFSSKTNLNDLSNMPEIEIDAQTLKKGFKILDAFLIANLAGSKSEVRRVAAQGGLSLNNEKIIDPEKLLSEKDFNNKVAILKKGKKTFVKLIFK